MKAMNDDELHAKASDYANNRRDGYIAKTRLGKVKKKTQDELNWIWVAHYEGYKEGHWTAVGDDRYTGEEQMNDRHCETPMMEFKQPTKIFGPNLEQMLNASGFYRKKEWVGLTYDEKAYSNTNYLGKSAEAWHGGVEWAETKLKESNK